jgi:hypothetical protein
MKTVFRRDDEIAHLHDDVSAADTPTMHCRDDGFVELVTDARHAPHFSRGVFDVCTDGKCMPAAVSTATRSSLSASAARRCVNPE